MWFHLHWVTLGVVQPSAIAWGVCRGWVAWPNADPSAHLVTCWLGDAMLQSRIPEWLRWLMLADASVSLAIPFIAALHMQSLLSCTCLPTETAEVS